MHKVFISYHHYKDQSYREELLRLNEIYGIFIDASVDTGDIEEDLTDQQIRQIIRDEYLRNSTVTILLAGTETKFRKHVDWEIYSSMYDGKVNKKSGILVINLPTTGCTEITASHGEEEKKVIYPEYNSWTSYSRKDYEDRYGHMPDRIIDNLVNPNARISVTSWNKIIANPENLGFLIDITFKDRVNCDYDFSRPMRRNNSTFRNLFDIEDFFR